MLDINVDLETSYLYISNICKKCMNLKKKLLESP